MFFRRITKNNFFIRDIIYLSSFLIIFCLFILLLGCAAIFIYPGSFVVFALPLSTFYSSTPSLRDGNFIFSKCKYDYLLLLCVAPSPKHVASLFNGKLNVGFLFPKNSFGSFDLSSSCCRRSYFQERKKESVWQQCFVRFNAKNVGSSSIENTTNESKTPTCFVNFFVRPRFSYCEMPKSKIYRECSREEAEMKVSDRSASGKEKKSSGAAQKKILHEKHVSSYEMPQAAKHSEKEKCQQQKKQNQKFAFKSQQQFPQVENIRCATQNNQNNKTRKPQVLRNGDLQSKSDYCLNEHANHVDSSRFYREERKSNAKHINVESFGGLKLNQHMIKCLRKRKVKSATFIQTACMKDVFNKKNVLIAAETGSGKTWGYLIPIILRLQQTYCSKSVNNQETSTPTNFQNEDFLKCSDKEHEVKSTTNLFNVNEKILILTPTVELSLQIFQEINFLLGDLPFSSLLITEQNIDELCTTKNCLECNFIVGSASCVRDFFRKIDKHLLLLNCSNISTIILDEADRLLQPLSKHAPLSQIHQRQRHPKPSQIIIETLKLCLKKRFQVIACTATSNRLLERLINQLFIYNPLYEKEKENMRKDATSYKTIDKDDDKELLGEKRIYEINQFAEHQKVKVVRTSESSFLMNNSSTLLSVPMHINVLFSQVEENNLIIMARKLANYLKILKKRILIFVCEKHSVYSLNRLLKIHGISEILDLRTALNNQEKMNASSESFVITASTSSARGIHFDRVDYVFILGKPKDIKEFLHAIGRTGRCGLKGFAVPIADSNTLRLIKTWSSYAKLKFEDFDVVFEEKYRHLLSSKVRSASSVNSKSFSDNLLGGNAANLVSNSSAVKENSMCSSAVKENSMCSSAGNSLLKKIPLETSEWLLGE